MNPPVIDFRLALSFAHFASEITQIHLVLNAAFTPIYFDLFFSAYFKVAYIGEVPQVSLEIR